ncbi:hypothetical protein BC831DRAFT_212137 [Entophlyctis helioformis]|nr:hypothetical protein BC831DRAFT_212137 [Entophlyctis helioformis]
MQHSQQMSPFQSGQLVHTGKHGQQREHEHEQLLLLDLNGSTAAAAATTTPAIAGYDSIQALADLQKQVHPQHYQLKQLQPTSYSPPVGPRSGLGISQFRGLAVPGSVQGAVAGSSLSEIDRRMHQTTTSTTSATTSSVLQRLPYDDDDDKHSGDETPSGRGVWFASPAAGTRGSSRSTQAARSVLIPISDSDSDTDEPHTNINIKSVHGFADFRRANATGVYADGRLHAPASKTFGYGLYQDVPYSTVDDDYNELELQDIHDLEAGDTTDDGGDDDGDDDCGNVPSKAAVGDAFDKGYNYFSTIDEQYDDVDDDDEDEEDDAGHHGDHRARMMRFNTASSSSMATVVNTDCDHSMFTRRAGRGGGAVSPDADTMTGGTTRSMGSVGSAKMTTSGRGTSSTRKFGKGPAYMAAGHSADGSLEMAGGQASDADVVTSASTSTAINLGDAGTIGHASSGQRVVAGPAVVLVDARLTRPFLGSLSILFLSNLALYAISLVWHIHAIPAAMDIVILVSRWICCPSPRHRDPGG